MPCGPWRQGATKKSAGVASLRGQGTPAYPARPRSERARNFSRIFPAAGPRSRSRMLPAARAKLFKNSRCRREVKALRVQPAEFLPPKKLGGCEPGSGGDLASRNFLLFFVATKEFVALNGGNHADGAFFARLGALHAAEAADAYGSGQSDLVGKGQKNLHGRAFPDILGKE